MIALPSKVLLVQACMGSAIPSHPVLLASRELACLHQARLDHSNADTPEIDEARRNAVREVDRWLSASGAQTPNAPFLHTETVGMVIDRIAEYSIAAQAGSAQGTLEPHRHYLWQRMSELAVAYEDLVWEIHAGRRRVPDFPGPRLHTFAPPVPQAGI